MKTHVKFFFVFLVLLLEVLVSVWLILSSKCVNWDSYLLSAWLEVAASSRATTDIQWLGSSSMSTPVVCQ